MALSDGIKYLSWALTHKIHTRTHTHTHARTHTPLLVLPLLSPPPFKVLLCRMAVVGSILAVA